MLDWMTYRNPGLINNRWWIYQKERFPILKYSLLILVFSGSAIGYGQLLQSQSSIRFSSWITIFLVTLGLFLQMRIADEFKDYRDDCKYRPERAIPRGLVNLKELAYLGIAIGVLQIILLLAFIPQSFIYLGLVWVYFFLMCIEFGCRKWLKQHLSIYMFSHMMILPLIGLLNLGSVGQFRGEYLLFALVCFLNGIVIEIGRKIRAPKDERFGVETYSSIWNPQKASMAWLTAVILSAIATCMAVMNVGFIYQAMSLLLIAIILCIKASFQFTYDLDTKSAKKIDQMSGLWIMTSYFSLGLLPILLTISF